MEGFGQCATSHSKLTKQTWAVFHQRGELGGWEGMGTGRSGDIFLDTGWDGAAVLVPSAGGEGRVWG